MRFFVSDLHGEYALFEKLLSSIRFSDSDEMFICGDIIEKGPESVRLAKKISKMKNVHCILGNHEYAFLKYYHTILESSPSDFDAVLSDLQRYFPEDGALLDFELVDFLESLPAYIEGEDFICVHAGLPDAVSRGECSLSEAEIDVLLQDRKFKDPARVHSLDKCVFFGHTETAAIIGEPRIIAYRRRGSTDEALKSFYKVHLDTGAWHSGVLGCFCADTCKVIYVK